MEASPWEEQKSKAKPRGIRVLRKAQIWHEGMHLSGATTFLSVPGCPMLITSPLPYNCIYPRDFKICWAYFIYT